MHSETEMARMGCLKVGYFIFITLMIIASPGSGATDDIVSDCISKKVEEYSARDDELAERWLSEQASKGITKEISSGIGLNMYQLHRLAELHIKDEKYRNWDVGKRLLMEAAKLGNRLAIAKLGEYYLDIEKDSAKATAILTCSADKGNPFAANVLGYYLALKPGLEPERGVAYMKFAAANGLDLSVFNLARLYRLGRHVPKDEQTAANMYLLLAQNGRAEACVILGNMHESGWPESPPNEEVALQWYRKGADLGDALGSYNAGRLLVIEGQLEEAKRYLAAAARDGIDDADKLLTDIQNWK
jgi:uncharacterized protein